MKRDGKSRSMRKRQMNTASNISRLLIKNLARQARPMYVKPGTRDRKRNHSRKKSANPALMTMGTDPTFIKYAPVREPVSIYSYMGACRMLQ
jgi:hypothetical protein